MKLICLSQRVEYIADYRERRDELDQMWAVLLVELGGLPVPLPNLPGAIPGLLERLRPDGILLTGGNSPGAYGGTAPERDELDRLLIAYAIQYDLPLLGVCRGMQSIVHYFGGGLQQVADHVATEHGVTFPEREETDCRRVNSFHSLGCRELPEALEAVAFAEDGTVEAVRARAHRLTGIMWHPERVNPFSRVDKRLIERVLNLEDEE